MFGILNNLKLFGGQVSEFISVYLSNKAFSVIIVYEYFDC